MKNMKTFVLVAIMENSLFGQWSFVAPSDLAVAEMMLGNPLAYENVFWGLRLHMGHVHEMDPRKFLQHIRDSYAQPRALAVYHLFEITPVTVASDSLVTAATG